MGRGAKSRKVIDRNGDNLETPARFAVNCDILS
jgi:hypothetical protein